MERIFGRQGQICSYYSTNHLSKNPESSHYNVHIGVTLTTFITLARWELFRPYRRCCRLRAIPLTRSHKASLPQPPYLTLKKHVGLVCRMRGVESASGGPLIRGGLKAPLTDRVELGTPLSNLDSPFGSLVSLCIHVIVVHLDLC